MPHEITFRLFSAPNCGAKANIPGPPLWAKLGEDFAPAGANKQRGNEVTTRATARSEVSQTIKSGRQAVRRSPAALAGDTLFRPVARVVASDRSELAKISWRVGALGAAYPTARRLTAILEISDGLRTPVASIPITVFATISATGSLRSTSGDRRLGRAFEYRRDPYL